MDETRPGCIFPAAKNSNKNSVDYFFVRTRSVLDSAHKMVVVNLIRSQVAILIIQR